MGLTLTGEEEALLGGAQGPAVQLAMRILLRMAQWQGADAFIPITSAHVDGCLYEGQGVVRFVDRLRELGARVAVPTTLNAISVELARWRAQGVPVAFGEPAAHIVDAYLAMGVRPSFSCAPYQLGHTPGLGEQVAWGESNAIAYVNSVLGARTDRYGDFLDILAAVAGRVPAQGLHLDANRRGQIVFTLTDRAAALSRHELFYPLLGYAVGLRTPPGRVPVVLGLPDHPGPDRLKAFFAAAASGGSVALAHLVGITPEAPDLSTALHHRPPDSLSAIDRDDLDAVRARLCTARGDGVDAVVLGSPHFSVQEFEQLARLVSGRRRRDGLDLVVTTSQFMRQAAADQGWLDPVERFGARVIADTCVLVSPLLHASVGTVMTNSGKYAHYIPGRLGKAVVMGSLEECVEAAVTGRMPKEAPWT